MGNFLKDWFKNIGMGFLFIFILALICSPTFLVVTAILHRSIILGIAAFVALIVLIALVITLDKYI